MAYQPTKPLPGDDLDVSVTDIQQNFQTSNTVMDINHYPFDDLTVNKGKHKFVDMPQLLAAPTTLAGEVAIYSKQGSAGPGTSALFMVRDGNLGTEVQLSTSSVGNVQVSSSGFVWLPGGAFMQWGKVASAPQSGQVTFPAAFDVAPYSIQVSIQRASSGQQVVVDSAVPPTATTFNFLISSPTNDLYWLAIGKRV